MGLRERRRGKGGRSTHHWLASTPPPPPIWSPCVLNSSGWCRPGPSQPRSVCPDQSSGWAGTLPASDFIVHAREQTAGGLCQREAPEGGDVLREGVSEPQFPSMHSGNRGGSSSQGRTRTEGEALADTGPGAPADCTSLDLYFLDPWGWDWRPLYRFTLRTKGAKAQEGISQGLAQPGA